MIKQKRYKITDKISRNYFFHPACKRKKKQKKNALFKTQTNMKITEGYNS